MRTIRYRLLAIHLTPENMKIAERERFFFAENRYILLYCSTQRKKPIGAVVVDADKLSTAAEKWLEETNLTLLSEFAKRHTAAARQGNETFLEKFEQELALERTEVMKRVVQA